jgi:hypothetical protein
MLQTYKQLEDKRGRTYAEKMYDLAQNKIFGRGSSVEMIKKFVENYIPKFKDFDYSLGESSGSNENYNMNTKDKPVVEATDILNQSKFHFSGVFSTGDPNMFYNLPIKPNSTVLEDMELPIISKRFNRIKTEFENMTKTNGLGEEVPVTEEESHSAYLGYIDAMLDENRDKIFQEADEFVADLKTGKLWS